MEGRWQRIGRHVALEASQRRIIVVLVGGLIGYGIVRLALNPVYIDAPQPAAGDRAAELADKLDLNTADVAELTALPGMGEKRAKAIIAWREKVRARDGKVVVFSSIDDLFYVGGFGRSMVDQFRPYLTFPPPEQKPEKTTP